MSPAEIILGALDLLDDPDRWTHASAARDRDCYPVTALSPDAVRWCAYGGITKACGGQPHEVDSVVVFVRQAAREHGYGGLTEANDCGGYETVLAVLQRALEIAGPSETGASQ